jgi:DNA-binding winged helix-turn-helix (wHTH) protein
VFDLSTQQITRGGNPLRMHAGCRKLLELLMRESPGVVSRERLEHVLWGDDPPDHDTLRSHIYELRKSVDGKHDAKLLQTLPKLGYCLVPAVAGK